MLAAAPGNKTVSACSVLELDASKQDNCFEMQGDVLLEHVLHLALGKSLSVVPPQVHQSGRIA